MPAGAARRWALWLNLGDSYFGGKRSNGNSKAWRTAGERGYAQSDGTVQMDTRPLDMPQDGLKPKDLIGIPWRVAFALQAAGWWLRADIIWAKRAPMPESVTDRPTRSHEHVFLLTKSARYFYDAEAVKEGLSESTLADKRNGTGRHTQGINYSKYYDEGSPDPEKADKPSWYRQKTFVNPQTGRNMRDVWHLSPEPYPDAHFATFSTEIPRRAILAGTSERGCCPACGAPWERVVEKRGHSDNGVTWEQRKGMGEGPRRGYSRNYSNITGAGNTMATPVTATTGWAPTCACPPAEPIPCTVLDPFGGSGTTAAVAVGMGRRATLVELNAGYVELAHARVAKVQRPLVIG